MKVNNVWNFLDCQVCYKNSMADNVYGPVKEEDHFTLCEKHCSKEMDALIKQKAFVSEDRTQITAA